MRLRLLLVEGGRLEVGFIEAWSNQNPEDEERADDIFHVHVEQVGVQCVLLRVVLLLDAAVPVVGPHERVGNREVDVVM